jgi:nucleotide-binding universal stress UspA family protein
MQHAHILAAVDGSAVSHNADRVAKRLATAIEGRHSTLLVRPGVPGSLATLTPDVQVVDGVASVEICRHAERTDAALIVLGRSEPRVGSAARPSTGEGIVRRSTIPTLHLPPGTGWFSRAVIALDDTERGLLALHRGMAVARAMGAPVELVTVEPAALVPVGGATPGPSLQVHRVIGRLAQLQISAPLTDLQGDPVEQLLATVAPDDLLIVGYRRGVDVAAQDGVGRRLIWTAPCAVLAVPL